MFTKNWYKILSAFALTQLNSTAINAGAVDYNGVERAVKFYDSNSVNFSMALGQILRNFTTASSASAYGVCFGDGATPATSDDYNMAGNKIKTLSMSVKPTATADNTNATLAYTYTLTNTGSTEVTIREIGAFGYMYYSSSYSSYLLERTVLDTPVTIPAGGVGQVTYTIRFNYPTA